MQNFLFAIIINTIVFACWIFLLFKNRKKGWAAVATGFKIIFEMLPLILIIIGSLGVLSSFIGPDQISAYLGDRSGIKGFLFISVVGSLLQIPGVIAFPIAAALRENGAAIATVAVFACASTMASVVTFPLEIKYLGKRLPFLRMGLTYAICVVVGALTGFILRLPL